MNIGDVVTSNGGILGSNELDGLIEIGNGSGGLSSTGGSDCLLSKRVDPLFVD